MASRIEEIRNLCRFCLCREGLMVLSEATNTFCFSVDDITLYTGIQICPRIPYAVCNGCCSMIKNWAKFRRNCLSNDVIIQKLVALLNVSVKGKADSNDTRAAVSSEVLASISQPNTWTNRSEDATTSHSSLIILDDSDSDNSMPSLYGECMQEASDDKMLSQSNVQGINASPGSNGKGQPTKEREDGNASNFKHLDSSYLHDSMPSLHRECTEAESGSNEVEGDNVSNSMDIWLNSTDSNDSDYSLPSIYEESIKEAQEELKEKVNAASSGEQSVESKYEREHVCPLCGVLSRDIYNHINRTHNKLKRFACQHCHKKFESRFQLKNHINTWHEKRIILTCEHCGRGFTNHSSHFYHMKNSHGESDVYECETCHRKFKSIDGYRKHLKEHSLSSYQCPDCDKFFKTPVTLEKHQLRYHPS